MTPGGYDRLDVVILRRGVPGEGIEPGTRAVVLDVHQNDAYEVEVVDDQTGATVWVGAIRADHLVKDESQPPER